MTDLARIHTIEYEGTPVIELHGEVDLSNADDVETALSHALSGRPGTYYLDLSNTTYLDSSGIRILFGLATTAGARRQQLCVIVPKDSTIYRVLVLTDFPSLVPMLASRSEIVAGS